MLKKILTGFLLLTGSAFAQERIIDVDYASGILSIQNIAPNPVAEHGTRSYSVTAGTLGLNTATPIVGNQTIQWTPAAIGDVLSTEEFSIPRHLQGKNCNYSFQYQAADGFDYRITDGTNTLLEEEIPGNDSSSQFFGNGFICPSSGNLKIEIVAKGTEQIEFDDSVVANNFLLQQISQSYEVGSIRWFNETNCSWSSTSGTFENLTATGCSPTSTSGDISAHDDPETLGFKINNVQSDIKYIVKGNAFVSGSGGGTGDRCLLRVSPGENNFASMRRGVNDFVHAAISDTIQGSDLTNGLVTVQYRRASGSTTCLVESNSNEKSIFLNVIAIPIKSQTATQLSEQDGYRSVEWLQSNNSFNVTENSTTFADIADAGFTTAQGGSTGQVEFVDGEAGFTANNLKANQRYRATFNFDSSAFSSSASCVQRVNTTDTIESAERYNPGSNLGSGSTGGSQERKSYLEFTAPSSGSYSFTLQQKRASGTGDCTIRLDLEDQSLTANLEIIQPTTSQHIMVDGITTNSGSDEKLCRVFQTSDTSTAAFTSPDDCVSSVTRDATGNWSLVLDSSYFKSGEELMCSWNVPTTARMVNVYDSVSGAGNTPVAGNTITVRLFDTSGSANDNVWDLECKGPRQ